MIKTVEREGCIGGRSFCFEALKKGLSDEVIQEQRTMKEVRE